MYVSNSTCRKYSRKLYKKNIKEIVKLMIFSIGLILLSSLLSLPFIPKNFNPQKDQITPGLVGIVFVIMFLMWIPILNGVNNYCINATRKNQKFKDFLTPLLTIVYLKELVVISGYCLLLLIFAAIHPILGLIFFLIYSFVPTIALDNPKLDVFSIYRNSRRISFKNLGRIIGMYITFIPSWLFMIITAYIGSILVLPYIFMTVANMYRTINGEELEVNLTADYVIKDEQEEKDTKKTKKTKKVKTEFKNKQKKKNKR